MRVMAVFRNKKRVVTAAAGLLLGAGALSVFLLRLAGERDEFLSSVRIFRYELMPPALLFLALMYVLRILRWKLLLSPVLDVSWRRVSNALFVGLLANNVLPARAGELVRPYVLQRGAEAGFSQALASVVVDRIFDLIGIVGLMVMTAVLIIWRPATVDVSSEFMERFRGVAGMLGAVLAGVMVMFISLLFFPHMFRRPVLRVTRILPEFLQKPLHAFINAFVEYILGVRDRKKAAFMLILAVGAFLFQGMSTYCLAVGFGMEIGLIGAFVATTAVYLAIALPQAPGYLGTYHLAAALAVELFDVLPAPAAAFAVMMWIVNIFPVTILGVVSLLCFQWVNDQ